MIKISIIKQRRVTDQGSQRYLFCVNRTIWQHNQSFKNINLKIVKILNQTKIRKYLQKW
jgi:hypothetical protein